MATTLHGKIPEGLAKHLATYATAKPISVAWQDVKPDFDTKAADQYLDVAYIPTASNNLTFGFQDEQHLSLFQVTVVVTAGSGSIIPMDLVGEIADHFKGGTVLIEDGVTLCVSDTPSPAQGIPEDERTRYPITIPIQVLT